MMNWPRLVLIGTFLPVCWLGMMIVHEAGHVAGAMMSGSTVTRVVLHPLSISRTDVEPNRNPLLVAACGPLVGGAVPLLVWLICSRRAPGVSFLARFFAGFCLIANGCYLAFGSVQAIGDAGDLLHAGVAAWQLWLFGLITVPPGFLIWHRMGSSFGIGHPCLPVNRTAVTVSVVLLVLLITLELAVDSYFAGQVRGVSSPNHIGCRVRVPLRGAGRFPRSRSRPPDVTSAANINPRPGSFKSAGCT